MDHNPPLMNTKFSQDNHGYFVKSTGDIDYSKLQLQPIILHLSFSFFYVIFFLELMLGVGRDLRVTNIYGPNTYNYNK